MSNYYDLIRKGLTGAVTVAAEAASKAAAVAKDLAEDLTSVKALKDYKLAGHVATAGPGNTWKIYSAISKKQGALFPEAAVWVLDKKQLVDQASRGGRARGFDQYFEQQRRGCAQLLRIKHPGVIKVLEQLEETHGQMVMVTEPVFGSLHNLQSHFRDVPNSTSERSGAQLSPLEIKYGMMHVAETVQFLHQEAKLVHCNLNPGTLIITRDGSWKLSGFAFVGSCDFGGAQGQLASFEYVSSQPPPWEEYVVPPLAYTAPELLAGSMSASEQRLHPASDVFSLAALAYELVAGRALLPVGHSVGEYRSRLSMLSGADMSKVPSALQAVLVPMMAAAPAARPNAASFASCQWFQEDMLLRALRFLDGILQRESSQKVAFLKDLSTFWQQFDERLLLHKILPPIVQEMRNEMVSLAALPMVLSIMGRMTPEQFRDSGILPVIKPVFDTADGELLLALVRHLHVFHRLMMGDAVGTTLLPLMLRACDSSSTKTQEEVLKGLSKSALDLPYQVLRDALMPKVIAMCLRTTSLVVRCAALGLMSQAVHRLDKEAALAMLDVSSKVLAVDKSAGTAMAVLTLAEATAKHYGTEVTAQVILPMLCPVLVAPTLSNPQFTAYMTVVKGMLDAIQEKRGPGEGAATGTAPSTPLSTTSSGGPGGATSGFASSSSNSMSSWTTGAASSSIAADATAGSSWQSAATFGPTTSSSSSRPAAQQAAASSSWSSAALGSSWATPNPAGSTGGTGGWAGQTSSSSSSSSTAMGGSWGAAWPAGGAGLSSGGPPAAPKPAAAAGGVAPGMPAPDIFSDVGVASTLGGLSLGGPTLHQPQQQQQQLGGDIFSGLALPATSNGNPSSRNSWSGQQQLQQPASSSSLALKPPPSAKTSIGLTGPSGATTFSSSSSAAQDPFAALSSGPATSTTTTSSWGAAAAAAPAASTFDPFAAAPAPAAAADPFAALATPAGGRPMGAGAAAGAAGDPFAALVGGPKPMGMGQQRTQPQQQQQQWGGSGGSLI